MKNNPSIRLVFSIIIATTLNLKTYAQKAFHAPIGSNNEQQLTGKFEANWESLSNYEVPEWYRNAKFGIWAHWGPQCEPGQGDWYGREMYKQGSRVYNWHVENYGHPSQFGFKDIIRNWKAENWDPEKLVALYKRAGAQYFFAMANHHDNMDLWDSKYQEWNSVNLGPKTDIIERWAQAAKNNDLPLGLSVHSAHAWLWYETAQQSDHEGPLKGVSYDGTLTKDDGKGTWWEGLDPQALYAQDHSLSEEANDIATIHGQWDWKNGASLPSVAYSENFYNRTIDLINKFNPDLIYFDDTALPLYPVSDAGLKIAAHYYNQNMKLNDGKLNAVLFGKILTDEQKKSLVWDVERGAPNEIQELPWQTCTCIGNWHYSEDYYKNDRYKSAKDVVHTLIDIVSKNGNLLLSVPIKGDGTLDDKEIKIVNQIGDWMEVNGESIFETRPWLVYGEGPAVETSNPISAQGFNEGKIKFGSNDIRFNQKGKILYASIFGIPEQSIKIKNLGKSSENALKIKKIELLGSNEKVKWKVENDHLTVEKPNTAPNEVALVYKIYQK
ncbi:alpha-L-fucosidase [Belliella sp. DSM 111904]|uniref:alpha-L-fucosidase n=1 Tax=Belliella filtrata TaxID=2923435 RepID=A0ABS9V2X9_9BACT|nr:alpha-L-fucosidase [Belliella filtrata]MCH7410763.1 alpha-L-fucosidase [Belliella filtrata]